MLAAILICGATVLTSCSNDDDNSASISAFPQPGDTWDAATGTLYVNSNPGKNAYKGKTDIVSVVFSDAVTSIGDSAFYDCHLSVVDLPASVVSIGSEAFAGENPNLQIVTIYAPDCTFGEHPFLQSIMVDIYVPAEAVAAYEAKHPEYADRISQIQAIPEAGLEGNEIVWGHDLCDYICVRNSYEQKDKIVAAHNTQGGITVTFTGTEEDSGFDMFGITLVQDEKLTFTSTVGKISKITIQTETYKYDDEYDDEDDEEDDEEYDDEPYIPVAEGWAWDAAENTFTWQGTPSATVDMFASGDIDLENIQIRFTIDGLTTK